MDSNWATEHLQVIRTLMERSAVYRRALAPIMSYTGAVGLAAGIAGRVFQIEEPRAFASFWIGVAVLALSGAFLLVRRQALKDSEPFWSPPTRRVAQALAPPLFVGALAAAAAIAGLWPDAANWLPPLWMLLYGCALSAAGFFMQRGIKLLGWGFILLGSTLAAEAVLSPEPVFPAHWIMAGAFGGLHLAYGVYLYFTEKGGK